MIQKARPILTILKNAAIMLLAVLFVAQTPMVVFAADGDLTDKDLNAINGNWPQWDPDGGVCVVSTSAAPGPVESNTYQADNAKAIIGIAKTLNLGRQGALIGLMVGLAETNLRNYANDGTYRNPNTGAQPYIGTQLGPISIGLPHDAVGHDNDSVGIMQQRAVAGHWGPVDPATDLAGNIKWLMTPAYAAEAFFAMPQGKKDTKALTRVNGWETMDPALAAQAVQVSFDKTGANYRARQNVAQGLLDLYYDSTEAIPLPVPLAGTGTAPDGTANVATNSACPAGGAIGTGDVSAIIATIRRYAWPDYRPTNGSRGNPLVMMDDYARDVAKSYQGGCNGVDCGAFVTLVMRNSGADPSYNNKNCNTTCQLAYLQANSGPGGKYVLVPNDQPLAPGDIAIRKTGSGVVGHTYFYIGSQAGLNGDTASASLCSRAPMAGPNDTRSAYAWYRLNAPITNPAATGGTVTL